MFHFLHSDHLDILFVWLFTLCAFTLANFHLAVSTAAGLLSLCYTAYRFFNYIKLHRKKKSDEQKH